MQLKVLCAAALVAALGVILLPGSALSVAQIHEHEGRGLRHQEREDRAHQ